MAIKSITKTRHRPPQSSQFAGQARQREGDTGRQTAWQTALVWVDQMQGDGVGCGKGLWVAFSGVQ